LAAYLTWPDARLRAYLREQGVGEEHIPGDRPNLLRTFATLYLKNFVIYLPVVTEETRIHWIQSQTSAEALFSKIKGVVNSGVYRAEEALHRLLSLLTGGWEDGKGNKSNEDADAKSECEETKKSGDALESSTEWDEDIVEKAREKLGEKVKVGEEKLKGEL
jgi:hypothetical protein